MEDLDQLLAEIRTESPRDPKNTYPRAGQELMIGPLEADELKSPNKNIGLGDAPYVNRDGGVITFESTGPKVGRGEVPNDVQARYRKFVIHAKQTGKPIPYLEYNGKRWYYQSRGKSLTNLETKLKVVADKTAREHAKTPTLEEYREVFGDENGTRLFNEEQEAMKKLTPGRKGTKTPEGYSRGHIRADAEGGRWHTRNLKLENTVRNAQQRQQVLTPEVENALMVGGNTNQEFIATQGPKTTPFQTQAILQGEPNVSRQALGKPDLKLSANGGTLKLTRQHVKALAGAGLVGVSFLGTGASAVETAGRTQIATETGNPLDWLQTGLSGLSLGADFVPGVGELISTPADAANVVIDTIRDPKSLAEGALNRRQLERKEQLQRKPADAPERSNALSVGFAEGGM